MLHRFIQHRSIAAGNRAENIISGVHAARRTSYADLQPREPIRPKGVNDGEHAVMPARSPTGFEAHAAEVQIEIVMDEDQITEIGIIEADFRKQLGHGLSAVIPE